MEEIIAKGDKEYLPFAEGTIRKINNALTDIKKNYFYIGFLLNEANSLGYYKTLGYETIESLAETEFDFGRSTTYGLMKVYRYAAEGSSMFMDDRYEKYGYSKLLEMSKSKTQDLNGHHCNIADIISPKDSVSAIKAILPYWNHYVSTHTAPKCSSIEEFRELMREQAPAPLLELAEKSESVQTFGQTELESAINIEKILKDSLLKGTGFENGKFRVYEAVINGKQGKELADFLKKEYGLGGWGIGGIGMNTSGKGYRIYSLSKTRKEFDSTFTWAEIAKRIIELVSQDEYLTDREKQEYLHWKANQDGLIVLEEPAVVAAESVQTFGQEERQINRKRLENLCINDYAKTISEVIIRMPKDFGEGFPEAERIKAWLFNWLISDNDDYLSATTN